MRLLSYDDLVHVKGLSLSKAQVNRLVRLKKFPRPVKEDNKKNAKPHWVDEEIDKHFRDLIAARDAAVTA